MSQIIKSYVAVFMLLFMTFCSLSVFACYRRVDRVERLCAELVLMAENSHFYADVLQESFQRAEQNNCVLTYTFMGEGQEECIIASAADVTEALFHYQMAYIELTYELSIPLISFNDVYTVGAYAL